MQGLQRGATLGFIFGLAIVFAVVAIPYSQRFQLNIAQSAGIYFCFMLSLLLALAPGLALLRPFIQKQLEAWTAWGLPLLWCSPYAIYALGTGDARLLAFGILIGAGLAVVAIYRLFPVRDLTKFAWQDLLVAAVLIATLMGHLLKGIWNVPANLDFIGRLFLIALASWTWVFVRPVPQLGYTLKLSVLILRAAAVNFVLFSLFAIPVGWALGFIDWHPLHQSAASFGASFLEIFLFIALLEEMFFRGFLQTLLTRNLRSPLVAQITVSCVFGLFHILHAPFPNWRYVLLATVAGWFYGTAFVKTGSLTASALTHALVDTMWRTFFTKS